MLYNTRKRRSTRRSATRTTAHALLFVHAYPETIRRPSADHDARVRFRYLAAERALDHSAARLNAKARNFRGLRTVSPTGVPNDRIRRCENSRPAVIGSGRVVALASTDTHIAVLVAPPQYDIAIDIERHDPHRRFDALAAVTMTDREHRRFRSLRQRSPRHAILYFYRVWTVAEAVAKLGTADILADAALVESERELPGNTLNSDLGTAIPRTTVLRSISPRNEPATATGSRITAHVPRVPAGPRISHLRRASFNDALYHVTSVRFAAPGLTITAASRRPLPPILIVRSPSQAR